MNLVVQEGIVLSERDPVVVLSRDTGAADALGGTRCWSTRSTSPKPRTPSHEALTMPEEERVARCRRLRQAAVALPPGPWFQAQLDAVNAR